MRLSKSPLGVVQIVNNFIVRVQWFKTHSVNLVEGTGIEPVFPAYQTGFLTVRRTFKTGDLEENRTPILTSRAWHPAIRRRDHLAALAGIEPASLDRQSSVVAIGLQSQNKKSRVWSQLEAGLKLF